MSARDIQVDASTTIARLALISVGYVGISVLSVQFLPRLAGLVFSLASGACVIGLVYAMGRSGAFRSLGWVRYTLFLVPALAIAYFLFFAVIGIGMGFFHWEPF